MRKFAWSALIIFFAIHTISAQNKSFNLNDLSAVSLKNQTLQGNHSLPAFENASRARELIINPKLQNNQFLHLNDTLLLDLFENKQYKATIDKVDTDVNGTSIIRAQIVGQDDGYFFISTFSDKSFITIEVPGNNEIYQSKYDHASNRYFLLQIDPSKQKRLADVPSLIPPADQPLNNDSVIRNQEESKFPSKKPSLFSNNALVQPSGEMDATTRDTISVMIVYTPAAVAWSTDHEGTINNTIAQLMAKAQLALDNSNTFATLQLVYSAQINYTELNSEQDLYNLTGIGDGIMDGVHAWRDGFRADVVVMLENMNFAGGIAWLLNSRAGQPSYAFSLNAIQQASWTYTSIHEIGHLLGCNHHKLQKFQPGPGLDSYAAGWRWSGPAGTKYCSVMTYEGGQYFEDGLPAFQVPHFSNPDIQYQGLPTGDAAHADNARTIRQTKSVVAAYRARPRTCTPPTAQASAMTFSAVTDSSMTISWTRGSGDSVLVVAKVTKEFTFVPANETTYRANSIFLNGSSVMGANYVVYKGTGTSVQVTNLLPGTSYQYAIYEYNSASMCYLMPGLTGNASTIGNAPEFEPSRWTWQNPSPQVNPLNGVKFISSSVGWAVGQQGSIIKTIDGGKSWTPQTSNTTVALSCLAFTDALHGTIVGELGTILRTVNGGTSWVSQSSGTTNNLNGVIFTDANTGTAVGDKGTILRTNDGGATWTSKANFTINRLWGVSFTDTNTGTVVGDDGLILKTTNGGTTWLPQSGHTTNPLFGVSFTDANHGTAVGEGGVILGTTDGGQNWTRQIIGSANKLYNVCFTNATTGTIVGESIILRTTDGGSNWTKQLEPSNWLRGVSFSDAMRGTAVGGDFDASLIMLKTTNGGTTWTEQAKSAGRMWMQSVAFTDAHNGVAVGVAGSIMTSADGGTTWVSKESGTTADFFDVTCRDANNWIAVGNRGAISAETIPMGQVCRTSDGGKKWAVESFPLVGKNYIFKSVAFTDVNTGYMAGCEGDGTGQSQKALILKTTNGGKEWTKQSVDVSGYLLDIHFSDASNGTAVGSTNDINGATGIIVRTTDGGTTWREQKSVSRHSLVSVFFTDANNGTIGSIFGTILRTSNGGTSWQEQSSGQNGVLSDIFFTDAMNGIVVSDWGVILRTKNGGTTWFNEPSGTKNILKGVYLFDANNGIAVGQGGTVLKKTAPSCPIPLAAGAIAGKATVCQAKAAEIYSLAEIPNATSYAWTYSGTGVTLGNETTNSIFLYFDTNATSGTLTAIGKNDCEDVGTPSTLEITISPLPIATGAISGTASVCQGQGPVTYTVLTSDPDGPFTWTYSGTGVTLGNETTNSISVTFGASAQAGILSVKGPNNCGEGTPSTLAIAVKPMPSPAGTITGPAALCQGHGQASYTVPAIPNATSYSWTFPKGIKGTSTTNSILVQYDPSAEPGTISVKGLNDCAEGAASSLAVTVIPSAAATGPIIGPANVCTGQATYSVSPINFAGPFVWTLPPGASGTSTTNSITVDFGTSPVSGFIKVRGHSDCGESADSTLAVTANILASGAGTITGPTTVCPNQSQVIYTVPVIPNAISYSWTLPAGANGTSTTNSISVNYGASAQAGNITVKGHSDCGEGTASILPVSINVLPATGGAISGSASVCPGQSTYTVPAIANATSYIWTLPEGATGTSTTNSITVTYGASAQSGILAVKGLTDCGEGALSTLPITINGQPSTPAIAWMDDLLHSDAPLGNQWYDQLGPIKGATGQDYSPNASGNYHVVVTIDGCPSEASNSIQYLPASVSYKTIRIFPNPTTLDFTFEIEGNEMVFDFDVINSLGQIVFNGSIVEKTVVPSSSFAPGLYLVRLKDRKLYICKKVIKL